MSDERRKGLEVEGEDGLAVRKTVSRREFLKIAGVAGAAVGAGAGFGGLLAACGEEETTTTAGPTTTAAPETTTTTAAPETTTTTAGPEAGREIKIGVISPLTGILAVFAIADRWGVGLVEEFLGEEMVLGDGKLHKVSWLIRDTQSDDARASQVTSDLILNDKADILIVGGSPTTAVPAAAMAEELEAPLLATNCPWQAFVFTRYPDLQNPAECPDKWCFGSLFGVEQGTGGIVQAVDKVPTNKVAGLFLGNTVDTLQGWQVPGIGMEDSLKAAGYTVVNPGYFNLGTEDFTAMISAYKKAGCELNIGSNPGKDFPNFWKQCLQQGYNPKACVEVIGLGATEDQEALVPECYGIIMGFTWHKTWPYSDPISGMTNAELADRYEKDMNKPWDQFITSYARFAWVIDILNRATDLDDKENVLNAVKTTKTSLITGPLDLTSPVDPAGRHCTPNIYKQPWGYGQLQKGEKWPVEAPLVAMIDAPEVTGLVDPFPIQYQ